MQFESKFGRISKLVNVWPRVTVNWTWINQTNINNWDTEQTRKMLFTDQLNHEIMVALSYAMLAASSKGATFSVLELSKPPVAFRAFPFH